MSKTFAQAPKPKQDAARWRRTWVNRGAYVHPYAAVPRYAPDRRAESHELHERTPRERDSYRGGRERYEEHDRRR